MATSNARSEPRSDSAAYFCANTSGALVRSRSAAWSSGCSCERRSARDAGAVELDLAVDRSSSSQPSGSAISSRGRLGRLQAAVPGLDRDAGAAGEHVVEVQRALVGDGVARPRPRGSRRRPAAARRASGSSATMRQQLLDPRAVAAQQVLDPRDVQAGLGGEPLAPVPQRLEAVGADQRRDVRWPTAARRGPARARRRRSRRAPSRGRSCTCRRPRRPGPGTGTATVCSRRELGGRSRTRPSAAAAARRRRPRRPRASAAASSTALTCSST